MKKVIMILFTFLANCTSNVAAMENVKTAAEPAASCRQSQSAAAAAQSAHAKDDAESGLRPLEEGMVRKGAKSGAESTVINKSLIRDRRSDILGLYGDRQESIEQEPTNFAKIRNFTESIDALSVTPVGIEALKEIAREPRTTNIIKRRKKLYNDWAKTHPQ